MGIEDIFNEPMDQEPVAPVIDQAPPEGVPSEPQAEALQEPTPQELPAPEPQQEPDKTVPLATFLDQRDEVKRWKREADELKRQLEQRNAKPADVPDPLDDPQGYRAHIDQDVDRRMVEHRFQVSDTIARQQHGADAVEAAGAWAAERARNDRAFAVAYMQQTHPIDWIVQQHKRDQFLTDVGDNVDDWFTREATKRGYVQAPAPTAAPVAAQQQPAPVMPPPPRSLAAAPSSGGAVKDVPVGPTASLEAVFQR